jgi:glycosyltransferase involved in cell wall biosynthesis
MSNALLEAMARGVPVVASDIPANAALIGAGGGGWLFTPGDDTELARTLAAVLTDPEALRSAGERGREVVTRRYSIDAVAERYGRLYAELKAEAS